MISHQNNLISHQCSNLDTFMASKTDTYTFLIFFSLGLWVIYFSTSENFKWNKMKWGLYRALF